MVSPTPKNTQHPKWALFLSSRRGESHQADKTPAQMDRNATVCGLGLTATGPGQGLSTRSVAAGRRRWGEGFEQRRFKLRGDVNARWGAHGLTAVTRIIL
eukprot:EG_transcript_29544